MPAGRDARQAPADRVAKGPVQPRALPGPGPVDRGGVDDHDLDPGRCLSQNELLGVLLGALVRRALRIVGDGRLRHGAPWSGVEDVEGGGVNGSPARPPRARPRSRCAAPSALTRSKIPGSGNHCSNRPMQLKTPSAPSIARRTDSGSVTSPPASSTPGREQLACLGHVSDQRDDLVAPVGQPAGDRVAHLAGRSGDQESHACLVRARPGSRPRSSSAFGVARSPARQPTRFIDWAACRAFATRPIRCSSG